MVSCLFLKTWSELPSPSFSLIHISPTDPLFCCCPRKTVRCHSAAEYRLHCSLFYLSHTHHQGDWVLNETAQSPVERAARRLSAHTHISYMRLLCVPHCPRQTIIWKQSRASFALDALLACLSPYAAKALILISLLVRSPPLYLSYVCDACRHCDETPALLCAFCSSTGQTTDLLSFNDIESASSLSIIWCVQSRKRSRPLLLNSLVGTASSFQSRFCRGSQVEDRSLALIETT